MLAKVSTAHRLQSPFCLNLRAARDTLASIMQVGTLPTCGNG